MKYYKDSDGRVFAFESDGSQDGWIGGGLVLIAEAEADALRAVESPMTQATALMHRDALLAIATLRIAPLQDAVDLGEATAAETAALVAWKQYRMHVNRVPQQAGFPATVDWPAEPNPS